MGDVRNLEVYIINYNGKNTILSTIQSLYESCDVKVLISVIDDHSADESIDLVKEKYPDIPVYILPYNTKKVNILRNKALQLSKSEFLFVTDNDLKFDKRCLTELLKVMESDSKIATCTPRLMYWDQPDKIYAADTKVHFIGSTIADQRDKIYEGNITPPSTNSEIVNNEKANGKIQKLQLLSRGNAISGAPIIMGTIQLASPTKAGMMTPNTIISPCTVTSTL